jgi:hypothetical protein
MRDAHEQSYGGTIRASLPIEEVLSTNTPHAKTTFALDQLYAYYALNEYPAIDLEISYELGAEEALISVTQAIIRGTLRLDIFETLPRHEDYDAVTHKVPSWVPNFYWSPNVYPFT